MDYQNIAGLWGQKFMGKITHIKSTNIDSPRKMMIPQYLTNRRSVGTNCVKTRKV